MVNNLNSDPRKWLLKEHWKSQNTETFTKNGLKHLLLKSQRDRPLNAFEINFILMAQFLMPLPKLEGRLHSCVNRDVQQFAHLC